MVNTFCKNPIAKSTVGSDKFGNFTYRHISSLKTIVPVEGAVLYDKPVADILTLLKTDTERCYEEWHSLLIASATDKSVREGKTISLKDALADVQNYISRKEGVVADKFPVGSPVYEEFYPLGLSEYQRVNSGNASKTFQRFLNVLNLHKEAFDAEMISEANEKVGLYDSVKSEQTSSKSKVSDNSSLVQEKRRKLSVQLYKNLLTLLLINLEEPEKVAKFFDESMLTKNSRTEEQPSVPETNN